MSNTVVRSDIIRLSFPSIITASGCHHYRAYSRGSGLAAIPRRNHSNCLGPSTRRIQEVPAKECCQAWCQLCLEVDRPKQGSFYPPLSSGTISTTGLYSQSRGQSLRSPMEMGRKTESFLDPCTHLSPEGSASREKRYQNSRERKCLGVGGPETEAPGSSLSLVGMSFHPGSVENQKSFKPK